MRRENTLGEKFLKSVLFMIAAFIIAFIITPPIFSTFAPMIRALPFETPTSYIVADYAGMVFIAFEFLIIMVYTKKWAWR